MALTQRFGFTYFGGDVEGTFYDDGSKYTSRDRQVFDRILAAFETHNHEGEGDRLGDPAGAPQVDLQVGSGALRPATTYYYRVGYVDQYGLETAASTEASVTTPVSIAIPAAPRIDAQPGGTLAPGIYWYALTAHQGSSETPLSTPQVANLSDWLSVNVEVPYALPAGCDAVSVWRQGPLENYFTRLVTIPIADPANPPDPLYFDDGSIAADPCACEPDQMPPDINMTGAASSVLITIPAGEVIGSTGVQRWRLYRSTSSQFDAETLLAQIIQPASEGSPDLLNTYLDDGSIETGDGQPLGSSQTLRPSRSIAIQSVATLPVAPGQGTVVFHAGNLWLYDDGAWVDTSASAVPSVGDAGDLVSLDGAGGFVLVAGSTYALASSLADYALQTDLAKLEINPQTVNYVLALSDAGKVVRITLAVAGTVTVPPSASVAYAVGTVIRVRAAGAEVTVTPGADVTLNTSRSLVLAQWSEARLHYVGSNAWDVL